VRSVEVNCEEWRLAGTVPEKSDKKKQEYGWVHYIINKDEKTLRNITK